MEGEGGFTVVKSKKTKKVNKKQAQDEEHAASGTNVLAGFPLMSSDIDVNSAFMKYDFKENESDDEDSATSAKPEDGAPAPGYAACLGARYTSEVKKIKKPKEKKPSVLDVLATISSDDLRLAFEDISIKYPRSIKTQLLSLTEVIVDKLAHTQPLKHPALIRDVDAFTYLTTVVKECTQKDEDGSQQFTDFVLNNFIGLQIMLMVLVMTRVQGLTASLPRIANTLGIKYQSEYIDAAGASVGGQYNDVDKIFSGLLNEDKQMQHVVPLPKYTKIPHTRPLLWLASAIHQVSLSASLLYVASILLPAAFDTKLDQEQIQSILRLATYVTVPNISQGHSYVTVPDALFGWMLYIRSSPQAVKARLGSNLNAVLGICDAWLESLVSSPDIKGSSLIPVYFLQTLRYVLDEPAALRIACALLTRFTGVITTKWREMYPCLIPESTKVLDLIGQQNGPCSGNGPFSKLRNNTALKTTILDFMRINDDIIADRFHLSAGQKKRGLKLRGIPLERTEAAMTSNFICQVVREDKVEGSGVWLRFLLGLISLVIVVVVFLVYGCPKVEAGLFPWGPRVQGVCKQYDVLVAKLMDMWYSGTFKLQ